MEIGCAFSAPRPSWSPFERRTATTRPLRSFFASATVVAVSDHEARAAAECSCVSHVLRDPR